MNRLDKIIIVLLIVCVVITCLCLLGCISDGQGGYRLSFGAADKIEKGLNAGQEGLNLLSLFVPGAAGLAGITGGVLGAFKKLKPQLTKQKALSKHVVKSIETIKKNQPELWAKIKDNFKDGANADIEELIDQIIATQKAIEEAKTAG